MARVRMVTRTIDKTVTEVMQINVDTAEVKIETYHIIGKLTSNEEILKNLNNDSKLVSENIKAVKVEHFEHIEVLYGMSEIDFINNAEILPPRTTGNE